MRTYLFRPVAEGRYPGLLLYSEIFQLTDPVRRMAAWLAGNGFVVAVPEIYHELEPYVYWGVNECASPIHCETPASSTTSTNTDDSQSLSLILFTLL